MNKPLHLLLLALLCLHVSSICANQKYEAEKAQRTADATIESSTLASGSQYVRMNGGDLIFTVNAETAGLHDMTVVFSQTYGDTKTQNILVNGTTTGSIVFPRTGSSLSFMQVQSVVRLKAGSNTITINRNWGWVDIDYIQLSAHQKTIFSVDPNPVTPNPSEGAAQVYAFLQGNFQKKSVSGVMTGDVLVSGSNTPISSVFIQNEVKFVHQSSGKYPAIVGVDFLMSTGKDTHGVWFRAYTEASMYFAEEIWQAGGIPTFSWHWRDPSHATGEFYTAQTDFDLTKAFTNSSCQTWNTASAEYKGIIRDIDIIANLLKRLKDKGVAVLWRPLHEASGGWFWWGAKGATPCKQLYRLMFQRMVNTHGLNNLIWVWNADGADADWYPGADVVDIIGRDYYYNPTQKNHSSLIGEFEAVKNSLGTSKMIALSENSSIPYPEHMQADGADWLYFMPWNGEHTNVYNAAADWHKIMNHDYVISLDEMPGWNTSTALNRLESSPHRVYADRNTLTVEAPQHSRVYVADLLGRAMHQCVMESERMSLHLPSGAYIVVVNDVAQKIVVP